MMNAQARRGSGGSGGGGEGGFVENDHHSISLISCGSSSWGPTPGHYILEQLAKLSTSQDGPRIEIVAVDGAHVALSLSPLEGGKSIVCAFAAISDDDGHVDEKRPSEALQRHFLSCLSKGRFFRLPGIVLGEPAERTIGLTFCRLAHAPHETRLLAVQADGLFRLWVLRVRQWISLTSFYVPFLRPIMGLSFDGPSRRLIYIEEIREDHQAAPPECLRIVSREMDFTPDEGGNSETITVGCAVSILQSQVHELHAVKAGSSGCWIILQTHISYNCFKSKRFISIDRQEQEGNDSNADSRLRTFFAHHAITEQLLAYEPDKGRIGVYSYQGGTLAYRVLEQDLESPSPSPSSQSVHSFTVHRNFAFVLAPPLLVVYHLRTGQLWDCINLPTFSSSSPSSLSRIPFSFWTDRVGATSSGVWSDRGIYRILLPSAQEEQARVMSCGSPCKSPLPLATKICQQYGSSMDRVLDHRALDAAYQDYMAALAAASNDVFRAGVDASQSLNRMWELPLVLKAGLLMGAADETVQETLSAEIQQVLHELDWLRGQLANISSNPIIRSEKSSQKDEMTRMASSFRDSPSTITPLLLAIEPMLREWLVESSEEEGGERGGSVWPERDRGERSSSSSVEMYCDAETDEKLLHQVLGKLTDGSFSLDDEELGTQVLYCCSLEDNGFLETLILYLYESKPSLLVQLVDRLQKLQMSLKGIPQASEYFYRSRFIASSSASLTNEKEEVINGGLEGRRGGKKTLSKSMRLGLTMSSQSPVHLATRTKKARMVGSGLKASDSPMGKAVDEDYIGSLSSRQSRPFSSAASSPAVAPPSSSSSSPRAAIAAERGNMSSSGGGMLLAPNLEADELGDYALTEHHHGEKRNDEEEKDSLEAIQALYGRALRLIEPPVISADGFEEKEKAYLALLEGAQRFVCIARYLINSQGRWSEAMALLDRLQAHSSLAPETRDFCGRLIVPPPPAAVNDLFQFMLETALQAEGEHELNRIDDIMQRRPVSLQKADLTQIAKKLGGGLGGGKGRPAKAALSIGPLKRGLMLLLEESKEESIFK